MDHDRLRGQKDASAQADPGTNAHVREPLGDHAAVGTEGEGVVVPLSQCQHAGVRLQELARPIGDQVEGRFKGHLGGDLLADLVQRRGLHHFAL